MARPIRIEYPGAVYHVICRGNNRQVIYRDDEWRRLEIVPGFGYLLIGSGATQISKKQSLTRFRAHRSSNAKRCGWILK
jgi:hypothetical protein